MQIPLPRRFTKSRLALHPGYSRILALYNDEFKRNSGKVNARKFYREVIFPIFPEFNIQSWYQFLARYKDITGLIATQAVQNMPPAGTGSQEEKALTTNLLSSEIATQTGIGLALNIGAMTLKDIIEHPEELAKLPVEKRIELLFKAMKAQDSRIHAIGKIRADNRDEARFDLAFKNSAVGQPIDE